MTIDMVVDVEGDKRKVEMGDWGGGEVGESCGRPYDLWVSANNVRF